MLFFYQAEDGIRVRNVTGVQTCALPIYIEVRVGDILFRNAEKPTFAIVRISTSIEPIHDSTSLLGIKAVVGHMVETQGTDHLPEIGRASCRGREKMTEGRVAVYTNYRNP